MALTRLFQVRLSDEQFAEIAKKAEDSGVSTAEWARNRLLGSTDVEIPVVQPPNPVVQEIMGDVLRLHPESITLVQEMTREEVAERYQGIKMHPVAFAAGEFPTTPIHAEVMPSTRELAAAIMAMVPGLKPLSQISAEESAELDRVGIPPMPVDWDDAPDEPRISWLADIEKVKADIEADNAAAGHEHWDCVTNDRCVSTKDARWTVLPNKAAVLQRARDLDAKYPISVK